MARKKKAPPAPDVKVVALLAKDRRPGEACALCGHWSVATEFGLDDKSGYCDRWEKLTDSSYWCDEFISRDRYQQMQDQLAEENEDYMDDDG